jgi:hypothetical protein
MKQFLLHIFSKAVPTYQKMVNFNIIFVKIYSILHLKEKISYYVILCLKYIHEKFQCNSSHLLNLFPHIDVFWQLFVHPTPFFEASNSEKMPYLDPNTVFRLRNVVNKSEHGPHHNDTSGGCQKGDVSPSVFGIWRRAVVPFIAKKILDMWKTVLMEKKNNAK